MGQNLQDALDMAAMFVQQTWVSVVRGTSHEPSAPIVKFDNERDRERYADSIVLGEQVNIPEVGRFSRTIVATDPIANEIEQGKMPWDMKPMLLGGPKARMSALGNLYNIIPFRHGTTNKGGELFKPMPTQVHDAAKMMKETIAKGKRALKYGDRLTGTKEMFPPQQKMFIKQGGKVGRYTHKTGKYEGMIKVQSGGQNRYLTFRTVSEKSDPNSWWHPGRNPQRVAGWVKDIVEPRIAQMLKQAAVKDIMPEPTVGMTVISERIY